MFAHGSDIKYRRLTPDKLVTHLSWMLLEAARVDDLYKPIATALTDPLPLPSTESTEPSKLVQILEAYTAPLIMSIDEMSNNNERSQLGVSEPIRGYDGALTSPVAALATEFIDMRQIDMMTLARQSEAERTDVAALHVTLQTITAAAVALSVHSVRASYRDAFVGKRLSAKRLYLYESDVDRLKLSRMELEDHISTLCALLSTAHDMFECAYRQTVLAQTRHKVHEVLRVMYGIEEEWANKRGYTFPPPRITTNKVSLEAASAAALSTYGRVVNFQDIAQPPPVAKAVRNALQQHIAALSSKAAVIDVMMYNNEVSAMNVIIASLPAEHTITLSDFDMKYINRSPRLSAAIKSASISGERLSLVVSNMRNKLSSLVDGIRTTISENAKFIKLQKSGHISTAQHDMMMANTIALNKCNAEAEVEKRAFRDLLKAVFSAAVTRFATVCDDASSKSAKERLILSTAIHKAESRNTQIANGTFIPPPPQTRLPPAVAATDETPFTAAGTSSSTSAGGNAVTSSGVVIIGGDESSVAAAELARVRAELDAISSAKARASLSSANATAAMTNADTLTPASTESDASAVSASEAEVSAAITIQRRVREYQRRMLVKKSGQTHIDRPVSISAPPLPERPKKPIVLSTTTSVSPVPSPSASTPSSALRTDGNKLLNKLSRQLSRINTTLAVTAAGPTSHSANAGAQAPFMTTKQVIDGNERRPRANSDNGGNKAEDDDDDDDDDATHRDTERTHSASESDSDDAAGNSSAHKSRFFPKPQTLSTADGETSSSAIFGRLVDSRDSRQSADGRPPPPVPPHLRANDSSHRRV